MTNEEKAKELAFPGGYTNNFDISKLIMKKCVEMAQWKDAQYAELIAKLVEKNEESKRTCDILTTEQVLELLDVTKMTLYRYIKEGKIKPKFKIKGRNYYSKEDLLNTPIVKSIFEFKLYYKNKYGANSGKLKANV